MTKQVHGYLLVNDDHTGQGGPGDFGFKDETGVKDDLGGLAAPSIPPVSATHSRFSHYSFVCQAFIFCFITSRGEGSF